VSARPIGSDAVPGTDAVSERAATSPDDAFPEASPGSPRATEMPDPEEFSRLLARVHDFLAKDLFFIGGSPKSGTTWLQVMLNAHHDICCRGEGHIINHFAPLLQRSLVAHNKFIDMKNRTIFKELQGFPGFDDTHFRYLLTSVIALLLGQIPEARTARLVGEKTPDNILHFARLSVLLPRVKFLHIVRDGRDCAVSAWFHNLRTNPNEVLKRHGTVDRFALHFAPIWKGIINNGLRFQAAHPGRCVTVRYEDLSLTPRESTAHVLRFLGADASPETVETCIARSTFRTMSGGRAPGQEDRTSFMRQGTPGNWREHLSPDCARDFVSLAGDAMTRLRYSV
jgi:Sulfotransferase family